MSYAAAIDQLNAMVPELYARGGQPRRKFELDQVRTLLHALGDPHLNFRSVLIAGTNGKGSTACTLASILTAAGQLTGLYTSPHLEKPNERIRINREEITDEAFARLFFQVHDVAHDLVSRDILPQLPSYFEMLTAQAFLYFAESKVDIAVLEVGMGGRLDATNVVEPLLSIITDISLDHMEWLGPTITDIAREKAGILRRGGTMIGLPAPQFPPGFSEGDRVLGEVARELGVRCLDASSYLPSAREEGPGTVEALGATITVDSPLVGGHQKRNVSLAIAAAVELTKAHGFPITPTAIEQGIHKTCWPGRMELISAAGVDWILDVAHNPAGAWALRTGLQDLLKSRRPHTLIFSCLRDKPVAEMAQILSPIFEQVIVAPIHSARAAALDDLLTAVRATGTPVIAAQSVKEALQMARDRSAGVVIVSGSVYLVGEARALLLAGKSEST